MRQKKNNSKDNSNNFKKNIDEKYSDMGLNALDEDLDEILNKLSNNDNIQEQSNKKDFSLDDILNENEFESDVVDLDLQEITGVLDFDNSDGVVKFEKSKENYIDSFELKPLEFENKDVEEIIEDEPVIEQEAKVESKSLEETLTQLDDVEILIDNNDINNNQRDDFNDSDVTVFQINIEDDGIMDKEVLSTEKLEDDVIKNNDDFKKIMESLKSDNEVKKTDKKSKYEAYVEHIKKNRKKSFASRSKLVGVLGALLFIFSIIGIVNTSQIVIDFSADIFNNTQLKKDISNFVSPFVIVDIPEFEDINNLDNNIFITTAVWKFIMEEELTAYEQDEYGNLYVPKKDIEAYVFKLFGSGVKFTNTSTLDPVFSIIFDEENQLYQIPSQPQFLTYTPEIVDVQKAENNYIVKLNYLLADPLYELKQNPKKTIVKVMEYVLVEDSEKNLRLTQAKMIDRNTDNTITPIS